MSELSDRKSCFMAVKGGGARLWTDSALKRLNSCAEVESGFLSGNYQAWRCVVEFFGSEWRSSENGETLSEIGKEKHRRRVTGRQVESRRSAQQDRNLCPRTHAKGGVSEGAPFGFLSHGVGGQFMALLAHRLKQECGPNPT